MEVISADTSGTFFICCAILSSRSNSLIAKNLFCSSGTSLPSLSSMDSSTFSTLVLNLCTLAAVPTFAATTAASAAFWIPVPFNAEISTTAAQPIFSFNLSRLILSPLLLTRSIIFTAITTGIPSSISCVDRYRLRSMFVPSTIFKMASGRSAIR